MMLAEVIAIGDELTSGQRLDTNSQWISDRLGELGIRVLYHTTVGDDLDANTEVFRHAAQRVDVVVATGGLGPTADDLTRQALACAAGCELVLDEPQLRRIEQLFQRRGRAMPEQNRLQAMFPENSTPIDNPHGTAPGIYLTMPHSGGGACHLFALPGVPTEMREMYDGWVAPRLASLAGGQVILHYRMKCFGVGESQMESMLPDLIRRGRDPTVGITVSDATVTLRIATRGASRSACREAMQPTIDLIRQRLGRLVYGEEDDELENVVGRLLQERPATLATVEWGTAGLLARWLSSAHEMAGAYRGGLTVPSSEGLALLGTELAVAPPAGDVAKENLWMRDVARACRKRLGADFALAVGPRAAMDENTPTSVAVALADEQGEQDARAAVRGHPSIHDAVVAKQALNSLRLRLLET
jgi:nicotinamide-nucleotide amidase